MTMERSKPVPVGVIPHNPFPVTARDTPERIPLDEIPPHGIPESFAEFMTRTRRYFRLTHRSTKLHYARGLESKPEDYA